MNTRWISAIMLLAAVMLLAACGGGGGSGGPVPPSDTESTQDSEQTNSDETTGGQDADGAVYPGFELALQRGSFWEFGYQYSASSWSRDGGTTGSNEGEFRVILGDETEIDGRTLYRVLVTHTGGDGKEPPLRWRYLGIDGATLLGSTDGVTLGVVFDAMRDAQPGGGLFADFGTGLVRSSMSSVSNDFVSGEAVVLSSSYDESSCEYFSDIGNVCGGDRDINTTEKEYFRAGVGPYAYHYANSYRFTGGGFESGGSSEWVIGLRRFVPEGDGYYLPPRVSSVESGSLVVYYGLHDGDVDPGGAYTYTNWTERYNTVDPEAVPKVVMRYVPATGAAEAVSPKIPAGSLTGVDMITEAGVVLELEKGLRSGTVKTVRVRRLALADHDPLDVEPTLIDDGSIYWGWLGLQSFTYVDGRYVWYGKGEDPSLEPMLQEAGSGSASRGSSIFPMAQLFSLGGELYGGVYLEQAGTTTGMDHYALIRLDPTDASYVSDVVNFSMPPTEPDTTMRDFALDETAFYFSIANFTTGGASVWRHALGSGDAELIWKGPVSGENPRVMVDAAGGYATINVVTENPTTSRTWLYDADTGQVSLLDLPGDGAKLNVQIAIVP